MTFTVFQTVIKHWHCFWRWFFWWHVWKPASEIQILLGLIFQRNPCPQKSTTEVMLCCILISISGYLDLLLIYHCMHLGNCWFSKGQEISKVIFLEIFWRISALKGSNFIWKICRPIIKDEHLRICTKFKNLHIPISLPLSLI